MNSWVWLWIDTTWNDFWVNLGVKSLLVVLAALLLSMLLRYAPARLRYSNFKIAFFALFVIPFGGFFPSLFMQSQPTRVPAESVISQLPVPYRKPLTANNVITELAIGFVFMASVTTPSTCKIGSL